MIYTATAGLALGNKPVFDLSNNRDINQPPGCTRGIFILTAMAEEAAALGNRTAPPAARPPRDPAWATTSQDPPDGTASAWKASDLTKGRIG